MDTQHEIRLRLRFFKDISENIEIVRQKFIDRSKAISPDFLIKVRESHHSKNDKNTCNNKMQKHKKCPHRLRWTKQSADVSGIFFIAFFFF